MKIKFEVLHTIYQSSVWTKIVSLHDLLDIDEGHDIDFRFVLDVFISWIKIDNREFSIYLLVERSYLGAIR